MSNTSAFPQTYIHTFRGKKYELTFNPSKALHIPNGWAQPEEGEEIVWDLDGVPGTYESNKGEGYYWEGSVIRIPRTGEKSYSIELTGDEMTADELRFALAEALVWAVEVTGDQVKES